MSIGNDNQAAAKCRQTSFDLKSLLEKLAEQLRNTGRSQDRDFEILIMIKSSLEKLSVEKAGLTFQSHLLNKLIEASDQMFYRLKVNDHEAINKPHVIAQDLLKIWGIEIEGVRPFKAGKLIEIQEFLHSSLFRRFFKWLSVIMSRNVE